MTLILREGSGTAVDHVDTPAFTPLAGGGVLVFVCVLDVDGASGVTMSDTLGGVTWNLLYGPTADSGDLRQAIFWATGLSGNGVITATCSGPMDAIGMFVYEFDGQHPTDFMGHDDHNNTGASTDNQRTLGAGSPDGSSPSLHMLACVCTNAGMGGGFAWATLTPDDSIAAGNLRMNVGSIAGFDAACACSWTTPRVAMLTGVEILAPAALEPAVLRRRLCGE